MYATLRYVHGSLVRCLHMRSSCARLCDSLRLSAFKQLEGRCIGADLIARHECCRTRGALARACSNLVFGTAASCLHLPVLRNFCESTRALSQGDGSSTDALVERLWHDVADDIHRNDADTPQHVSLSDPLAPSVRHASARKTEIAIPVRAGVDLQWLESALLQLQNAQKRGKLGGVSFSSTRVLVRDADQCRICSGSAKWPLCMLPLHVLRARGCSTHKGLSIDHGGTRLVHMHAGLRIWSASFGVCVCSISATCRCARTATYAA